MIFYDCEIKKAIPGDVILPGIEYCAGWHDQKNMGKMKSSPLGLYWRLEGLPSDQ